VAADNLRFQAQLQTSRPIDQALDELQRLPLGSQPRIEQPDATTLLVATGSRLRYRLLGMWAGRRHLPALLRFELEHQAQGASTTFTMTSDEGWYAVQTPLAHHAFSARWDELLAVLAAAGFVARRD